MRIIVKLLPKLGQPKTKLNVLHIHDLDAGTCLLLMTGIFSEVRIWDQVRSQKSGTPQVTSNGSKFSPTVPHRLEPQKQPLTPLRIAQCPQHRVHFPHELRFRHKSCPNQLILKALVVAVPSGHQAVITTLTGYSTTFSSF